VQAEAADTGDNLPICYKSRYVVHEFDGDHSSSVAVRDFATMRIT
jgi:hypothetical protein